MSEYVKRIMPFGSCDILETQHWLEEMSAKGLHYVSSGYFFAKFRKGEPKQMRYRLDFCDVIAGDIPEEKREMYEAAGWEVIGDYSTAFVLLRTEDADAPEVYSDPEKLLKPMKTVGSGHVSFGVALLIMALCTRITLPFDIINHWSLINANETYFDYLFRFKSGYFIFIALMALLLIGEAFVHFSFRRRFRKYMTAYADGEEIRADKKQCTRAKLRLILSLFALPLVILWVVHWAEPIVAPEQTEITDLSLQPFPTAEDMGLFEGELSRQTAYNVCDSIAGDEIKFVQIADKDFHDGVDYMARLWYSVHYRDYPSEFAAKCAAEKQIDGVLAEGQEQALRALDGTTLVRDKNPEMPLSEQRVPKFRQERYELDGADVFWLRYLTRGYAAEEMNIYIIRLGTQLLTVECECPGNLEYCAQQYIDALKSAK